MRARLKIKNGDLGVYTDYLTRVTFSVVEATFMVDDERQEFGEVFFNQVFHYPNNL